MLFRLFARRFFTLTMYEYGSKHDENRSQFAKDKASAHDL